MLVKDKTLPAFEFEGSSDTSQQFTVLIRVNNSIKGDSYNVTTAEIILSSVKCRLRIVEIVEIPCSWYLPVRSRAEK